MGCCTHKPNREGAILIYWLNMPLKKVSLQYYHNDLLKIKENHMTKFLYEAFLYPNNKYVIYNDEKTQKASKQLFEKMHSKYGSDWVLFTLAFMVVQDKDMNLNKKHLLEISKHLKLNAIDEQYNMSEDQVRKLYTVYVDMVSNSSVDPVFDNMFEKLADNDDYRQLLHNHYRDNMRQLIVDYYVYHNDSNEKVGLDALLGNNECFRDDNVVRIHLEDANSNGGKYIVVRKPSKLKQGVSAPSRFEQPKLEETKEPVFDYDDDSIPNPGMFGHLL
jgi:hypothetical protein